MRTGRTGAELVGTAALVRASGWQAATVEADVCDRGQVDRLHRTALDLACEIDIIVNNAGNLVAKPFVALPPGDGARSLPPPLSYDDW